MYLMGTSLVVHWLRLWTSNTRSMDSISGQRTTIPHAMQCGQKSIKKTTIRNVSHDTSWKSAIWPEVKSSPNANSKSNSCKVLVTANTLINSVQIETQISSQQISMRMGAGQPIDINFAPVFDPSFRALSPHSTCLHFSHQLRESYLLLVMRNLVIASILPSFVLAATVPQFFQGNQSPTVSPCTWVKVILFLEN